MTRFYHNPFSNHRSDSVYYFLKSLPLALIAGIVILAASCKEDATALGKNLLPPSDFVDIHATDTLTVRALTLLNDSIEAGNVSTSFLGVRLDPYFGRTTASFVSQIRIGTGYKKDTYTIDSIKLFLRFLSLKGTGVSGNLLNMYETSEQIYKKSIYYSSRDVPLTGDSWTGIPIPDLNPKDTVNAVVIDIPVTFGTRVMREQDKFFYLSDTSELENDFRAYFKGLHFTMTCPGEPVMLTLSLSLQSAAFSYSNYFIFYTRDSHDNKVQCYFILDAQNPNAHYNKYEHYYDEADPDKKIMHYNDGVYDSLIYLQYLNGVYSKVTIPGLKELKNDPSMDNVAINKAWLTFPYITDGNVYTDTTTAPLLLARCFSTSGWKDYVPDINVSTSFFGGTPDKDNNVYKLNLSTFVQRYLDDKADTLLPELEIYCPPVSSYNAILRANSNHIPVKFELTYTKF